MNIEEKVFYILKESKDPLKSKEIAEKSGFDKKEIDKAIKSLKKSEKIFSPKNCFYSVKNG